MGGQGWEGKFRGTGAKGRKRGREKKGKENLGGQAPKCFSLEPRLSVRLLSARCSQFRNIINTNRNNERMHTLT